MRVEVRAWLQRIVDADYQHPTGPLAAAALEQMGVDDALRAGLAERLGVEPDQVEAVLPMFLSLTGYEVAERFAALLGRSIRREGLPETGYGQELSVLADFDLATLRVLWDLYDGCNSPLGFSGEAIHVELNRRGDGGYCAV